MQHANAVALRSEWLRMNSSSRSREFASVRLSDPEKGYERQGRYLARSFGVQWFEYWSFLDDFVDLASESGLKMLEKYLQEETAEHFNCAPLSPLRRSETASSDYTNCSLFCDLNGSVAGTPISRRASAQRISSASCGNEWNKYRSLSDAVVLNDSLEDSSDASASSLHLNDSSDRCCSTSEPPGGIFSPIMNLLQKLTFSSPLRWLLIDGPIAGEPLFDPVSPIPSHKKPVPLRGSSPSPGKRKASLISTLDRPAAKKLSAGQKSLGCLEMSAVPLLYRQIFQALPGGDLEMDTAVAALSYSEPLDSRNPNRCSLASCLRAPSLSQYHTVTAWKARVQAALNTSLPRRGL